MPVEREEFLAAAGFMPQDDQRSVVLRSGIVRDDVDNAIQRRAERSARLNKKVHAEVNCAPFVRGIAARAEQRRSVKQSRLIVTPDTNRRARALHCVKYLFGECGSFRSTGIGAKKRAASAQIKNEAPRRSSQLLIFSPCATGEIPQTARKVWCAKRGWIFASRSKASHAGASLTVTYGSSGFSVLQCAELVTLTASRAAINA